MKTKTLLLALIGIALSITLNAKNINIHDDDTIRIKTENDTEMIIILNECYDVENLSSEINDAMQNLDDIFDQIEDEIENMDSVINISVKNIDNKIIVNIDGIEKDESKKINIDFDTDKPIHKKETNLHFFGTFNLGFNNYIEGNKFPGDNNAQYAVKPWGSWYVSFGTGLRWYIVKPIAVDLAADLSWNNFKYQDRSTRVIKTDDGVEFNKDNTYSKYIKSKTTVPYINLSFVPMVYFGKKNTGVNHKMFRIGAGVYGGYRIGGHIKYVYEDDNNIKVKYKDSDNYFFSSYRYGVKAIFGVSDINIFASYDLSTFYASDKGPSLNPIVIGLNWTF